MIRHLHKKALWALSCLALVFTTLATHKPTVPVFHGTVDEVKASISRSLPFLLEDGQAWLDGEIGIQGGQACVSCHQTAFGIWSHNTAKQRGIEVDEERLSTLANEAVEFFVDEPGERRADNLGHMFLGRSQGFGNKDMWQEFLNEFVERQTAAGNWQAKGQFPRQNRPRSEADQATTMWTILAMSKADELSESQKQARQKALRWMLQFEDGQSREWLALKMLVEHKLGGISKMEKYRNQLISAQNSDGGWSWRKGNVSDSFMTGQTIYALSLTGLTRENPVIQNGVKFLLHSQNADGVWEMSSASVSNVASNARDYIYKYWGTAWAVIGLSETLPCLNGHLWTVAD